MNRKELRALTLVGPTRDNPVLEPLAVLHINNRLYITCTYELKKGVSGKPFKKVK